MRAEGAGAVPAEAREPGQRVAISNSRLVKADAASVIFKVENYRVEGRARYTTMTLDTSSSDASSFTCFRCASIASVGRTSSD
jgi:Putative transposase